MRASNAAFGVDLPATQAEIVMSGSPVVRANSVRVIPRAQSMRCRFAEILRRASLLLSGSAMPQYYRFLQFMQAAQLKQVQRQQQRR